ncbi:hypothetical protein N7516_010761 [Penicillium verrucosum]|uniref:uncharacterized protein n=1 Tax=Penicillium verrucosum TaxID=60171 RepID=UPI002544DA5A|nr:uncharacterized protein N7516_010761 [Penicillium verrucosum]KAJ5923058.1 hypothetical protein N7516_010761 [Penicillium verrucosum]
MPTEVHDSCQDWWRLSEINLRRIGDLTEEEQAQLDVRVGTSKIPTSVRWRSVSVVTQGT